ncbi:dihydroorotase [Halocatena salina]|uniref:Dihydroorotase n=1 Tax=Halocatena salina TaxID=2934340 RepID=A0A8U0A4H3_9EURY|nr:dihydroorotase [Halocatena salina]UPM44111.1 dihydroorotase [Halocatena salina]
MLIETATLADGRVRDVRVTDGRIETIDSSLSPQADETVRNGEGKLLLPGMIDTHVHFREPGASHKETWTTGSKSAAAGGVTTVVDQPNTDPPTTTPQAFEEKRELAQASYVDFGLNGGVTPDWSPALLEEPLFALGEVFLADSTGNMGIDTDLFETALQAATEHDITVTVHAEDATQFEASARERSDADAWSAYRTPDAEIAAVEHACDIGTALDTQVHIAHTSTPAGIDRATAAGMTCEVTPHHLFLSRNDLDELGTFGRMNPPLRSEDRRQAVYDRVADGTVDLIATDHAPHTRAEKETSIWDAPSGVPGVETALPLLLEEARAGRLGYERVRDLTATNPARLFELPRKGRIEAGRDADLVLVDPDETQEITADRLHSNCEWTPFEGRRGVFPEWTMVRGRIVYENGDFGARVGRNVRDRTAP